MTEVFFYHLQNQPLERVLPTLLEKCLERGWRCVVQASTEERVAALDDHLWTFSDDSFLPHGTAKDGAVERQPILLTTAPDNPNGAAVRVLVESAAEPDLSGYERAIVLFDGNDPLALDDARARWKRLKAAGHAVTYWQQDERGRWAKKA